MLALSSEEKVYFWGRHTEFEVRVVNPELINVPNVAETGIARGCSVSAFKTTEGKVYFWGFAYDHHMPEPVAKGFSSLDALFASLENPVMLRPLQCNLKLIEVLADRLRQNFDDDVNQFPLFMVYPLLLLSLYQ